MESKNIALRYLKRFWNTLKLSFTEFQNDNAIKMSASLSYYTVFSLGPFLIIIISLAGLFLGEEAVQGKVYDQVKGLIGANAADQLEEIIKNARLSGKSIIGTIVGGISLLIGATGVFAEIQDSINTIWGIKSKPKRGWLKYITNRLLSFSMVVSIGFLLLVSLIANAALDIINDRLSTYFADYTAYLYMTISTLIIIMIISTLFAVIFRVLPDGHVRWRDAGVGALFTTLLFLLGKYLIGLYLGRSSVASVYGAAGSIVLVLLWVYYSSAILFFGAEFTKVYALVYGGGIIPTRYAVFVEKKELESKKYAGKHLAEQKKELLSHLGGKTGEEEDEETEAINYGNRRGRKKGEVDAVVQPTAAASRQAFAGFVLVMLVVNGGRFLLGWLQRRVFG